VLTLHVQKCFFIARLVSDSGGSLSSAPPRWPFPPFSLLHFRFFCFFFLFLLDSSSSSSSSSFGSCLFCFLRLFAFSAPRDFRLFAQANQKMPLTE
jgi:hypothetical protein